MKASAKNRRTAPRKSVGGLHIKNLSVVDHFELVAKRALLVDASSSGLMVQINRKDLEPKELRQNLTLQALVGHNVMFEIDEMELEIDGKITRTKMIGKGIYEVAIDFTEGAPEYWRECLVDLLPDKENQK